MIKLYNPVAEGSQKAVALVPRVQDLKGKVVGFTVNQWTCWDTTVGRFAQLLTQQYGVAGVVTKKVPNIKPAPKEALDDLARNCDVLINGIGH